MAKDELKEVHPPALEAEPNAESEKESKTQPPRQKMSLQEYNRRRNASQSPKTLANTTAELQSSAETKIEKDSIDDIIQQELAGIVDPTIFKKATSQSPPPPPKSTTNVLGLQATGSKKPHISSLPATTRIFTPNKSDFLPSNERNKDVATPNSRPPSRGLSDGPDTNNNNNMAKLHISSSPPPIPSQSHSFGTVKPKVPHSGPRNRVDEDVIKQPSPRITGLGYPKFSPSPPPPLGSRRFDQPRRFDREHHGSEAYSQSWERYEQHNRDVGSHRPGGGVYSLPSSSSYRSDRQPPPPPPPPPLHQQFSRDNRVVSPTSSWDRDRRSSQHNNHYNRGRDSNQNSFSQHPKGLNSTGASAYYEQHRHARPSQAGIPPSSSNFPPPPHGPK